MIIFNKKIIAIKFTKNALFIIIDSKIIVYDIINLKYLTSFSDIYPCFKKTSINQLANKIVLAHASTINKSIIKITKCI